MGRFLTPTGGSPRPSRAVVLVLASALSLGVLGSASAAKDFTVCANGCTYTTVTAALAAAANGGVITIGPGTYAGGFTVDKNVTLEGAGAKKTTIRGGDRVITISGNVSASINGVTISGGTGSGIFNGSGIFVGGFFDTGRGMLSLGDSTVSGNAGAGIGGGGAAAISRSTISDNGGAGLFIGLATIENSIVSGNGGFGVGAIYRGGVTITHSTISDNAREGLVSFDGPAVVEESTISGNARGGVNNGGFFPMTLRHSVVSGNSATFGGGIWSCCAGEIELIDSKVIGNTATQGGGIYVGPGGGVSADHSVVTSNTATGGLGSGGGAWVSPDFSFTITNSKIVRNAPDDCVGC